MTTPDPPPPTTPPTPSTPTTKATPPRLVVRHRDDLVAMVPLTLGFSPAESVTMLTFAARTSFHARVDLPRGPEDDAEVVDLLLEPVLRHAVDRVAFVVHSARARRFEEVGGSLVRAFLGAGVEVVEALRADGERAWCLDCTEPSAVGGACPGHPCDVSAHPFLAHAVLEGRVVHGSREDLAATLDPGASARAAHGAVREAATRHATGLRTPDLAGEGRWLGRTVRRHLATRTRPDDRRLGRLLADLSVVALRDPCWERMRRADAREQVELWRDVVRRAPDDLVAPAAGVLAVAAWLAGDGALAWCAVDRGRVQNDGLDLLGFVADLLERAEPPGPTGAAAVRRDRGAADTAPDGPQVA